MNWIVVPQDDPNDDKQIKDLCIWSLMVSVVGVGYTVCKGSDVLCVCSQFKIFAAD